MYRQLKPLWLIASVIITGCTTLPETRSNPLDTLIVSNANSAPITTYTAGGKRVALVIGNGAYQHPEVWPSLANPSNDAVAITNALHQFGFTVLTGQNLTQEQMEAATADFTAQARGAEAALFYYSGHGMQIKNQNYLLPIESDARTDAQVAHKSLALNYVLDEMDNSNSVVKIAMLDACRSNKFNGSFREGGGGLARASTASKNTVIVYATEPGNVASDGAGKNGIFTAGLLAGFKSADLSLDGVLTKASEVVETLSGGTQTPFVDGPQLLKKRFRFADNASGLSTVDVWGRNSGKGANAIAVEAPPTAPDNSRLLELQQQRLAEEAKLVKLKKQREAEEAKLAESQRQQQLEEQQRQAEVARLAEIKRQQEAEAARPAILILKNYRLFN